MFQRHIRINVHFCLTDARKKLKYEIGRKYYYEDEVVYEKKLEEKFADISITGERDGFPRVYLSSCTRGSSFYANNISNEEYDTTFYRASHD